MSAPIGIVTAAPNAPGGVDHSSLAIADRVANMKAGPDHQRAVMKNLPHPTTMSATHKNRHSLMKGSRRLDSLIGVMVLAMVQLVGAAVAQEAATPASSGERTALVQACKADYLRFCRGVKLGGGEVLSCFQQHANELSSQCKAAAAQQRPQATTLAANGDTTAGSVLPLKQGDARNLTLPAGANALPAGSKFLANIAYGSDKLQKFDVYLPPAPQNAPIIFMVHGGAWVVGDKSHANVFANKAAHWLPKGYVFVSVNNRMLPKADPLVQAQDVAAALAKVEELAPGWHADPSRLVLMGHSAGAHLVGLLVSDTGLMRAAGAKPGLGAVLLDSGAVDVPAIMQHPHAALYDRAFGKDPAFWEKVSPQHRLTARTVPLLLVCSSQRADSCPANETFAKTAIGLGGSASVLPEPKSHADINEQLGLPGAYTEAVDKFLAGLGLN
jgi:acetyl esterase/lipase